MTKCNITLTLQSIQLKEDKKLFLLSNENNENKYSTWILVYSLVIILLHILFPTVYLLHKIKIYISLLVCIS